MYDLLSVQLYESSLEDMLHQMIFVSLIFGMIHYLKNWVKGHDNILKITVTNISENV